MVDTLHPASSATDSAVRSCSPALVKISSCFIPQGYTCSDVGPVEGSGSAGVKTADEPASMTRTHPRGLALGDCTVRVAYGRAAGDTGAGTGPRPAISGALTSLSGLGL